MGNRDLRKQVAKLATSLLLISISVVANEYILDDFENTDISSDNINYNRGKWELFDDNAPHWDQRTFDTSAHKYTDPMGMLNGGNSRFTKMNDSIITEKDIRKRIRKNANGDTLGIERIYPSLIATDGAGAEGDRALKLGVTLGDKGQQTKHDSDSLSKGFIGLSTTLSYQDWFQPLSSEAIVNFNARVEIPQVIKEKGAEHLELEFHIETEQHILKLHNASYRVLCKITEEWQTFSYKLDFGKDDDTAKTPYRKFYQHNWWAGTTVDPLEEVYWGWECDSLEFIPLITVDPKWEQSKKLKWMIRSSNESDGINKEFIGEEITLYFDDISIENYTPLFDDFLQAEYVWADNPIDEDNDLLVYDSSNVNTIGGGNPLYIIDDNQLGNKITESTTQTATESFIDQSAENAKVAFTLGNIYKTAIESDTIQHLPFAGIAMDLYEDAFNKDGEFDVTELCLNGIKFSYKTMGDLDLIQVRMRDNQRLKAESARFLINIPGTEGTWKDASISFNYLDIPWWDSFDPGVVLNQKALRTLEFVHIGTPGQKGELYIDNVYFIHDAWYPHVSIKAPKKHSNSSIISIQKCIKGPKLSLPREIESAQVQIFDLRGQQVHTQEVSQSNPYLNLKSAQLGTNLYIMRVLSTGGKRLLHTQKFTVSK